MCILYDKTCLNTDTSSSVISILNIHVFSYIYIHCILKTSGMWSDQHVYCDRALMGSHVLNACQQSWYYI